MGGRATERRRAEGETKPRKGWKGGKGDRRWEARTSPRATSTAWRWLVSALVLKFHLQAHGSHWRTANKRVTFGPSWPIVHGPEIQRDYRVVSEIWWSRSHLYSILTNHGKLWSKKKNDIRWLIFFFFYCDSLLVLNLFQVKNCCQLVPFNSHYSLFWKGYNWNKTTLASSQNHEGCN